jgi:hypothetical protein
MKNNKNLSLRSVRILKIKRTAKKLLNSLDVSVIVVGYRRGSDPS